MGLVLNPPPMHKPIPGAPHFTLAEMIFSRTARKYNLDNSPGENALANLCHLAREVLEPLRKAFGPIQVTSGYRGPELNWFVSTTMHSNHCQGQAADIRPQNPGVTCLDLLGYTHHNLDFHELIAEHFPHGWVHVGLKRSGPQARRLLEIRPGKGARIVTLAQLKRRYS